MKRITIFFIAALFLLMISTLASADMLKFSDVVVEVDNDKQSATEAGGSIKILPDSELTLKITVENLFDNDVANGEIQDIEITAVLEEVDDGDDLEETSDNFDIRPGRDKTVTMKFDIPLKLETDASYVMTLDVEGEDQNGTMHYANLEFDVSVDKEKHELRFLRKEIVPAKVTCTRTAKLVVDLINTGEEDEDVELVLDGAELDYNKVLTFEMYEDIDDDDNEYTFSDNLDLGDLRPGVYSVFVKAIYYDSKRTLEDTLTVEVGECASSVKEEDEPETTPAPKPEPKPEPVQPTVVEVVSQPTVPSTSAASQVRQATAVATPRTTYTQKGFWDENKWVMIIVLTDLILLGVGALVVYSVLKRRK
ncbi:MAG: hypothetical protein V1729_01435 [Candidatus Woesearchaeota archaeon]